MVFLIAMYKGSIFLPRVMCAECRGVEDSRTLMVVVFWILGVCVPLPQNGV